MSESTQPADKAEETTQATAPDGAQATVPTATAAPRRPRAAVRLFGLLLVVGSVALATYLLVAYFAFESGRTLQAEQQTAARDEQLRRQIELAREDLAEGSSHLALTRLDWVLAQEADNAEALALREQAAAADAATATPRPTFTPRPTSEAVAAATPQGDAEVELQTIRGMVSAERWAEALPLLTSFQQRFPDERRQETDQLLFDTLIGLGLSFVNTEKVELGLNYFAQAERLGDLPPEVHEYRAWADLYFEGVAYSGVNWAIATDYWRDLCAAAPFYQDACVRLQRSLVGWGDQLAYAMDWCPAISIYQEAWNQNPSDALGGKLAQAREGCAAATPIPPPSSTVPLTGTVPITGTDPLTPTEPGG